MEKANVKTFHVMPCDTGWVIKEETSQVNSFYNKRSEAIAAARELSRGQESQLIIHVDAGREHKTNSHSPAPLLPKKTRKVLFPHTPTVTNKEAIRKAVRELILERDRRY
jgi:uncharacterized protein DUF2188